MNDQNDQDILKNSLGYELFKLMIFSGERDMYTFPQG